MFLLLSPLIIYESASHRLLTCSFCTFLLFNDMLGFYYFSILEEAIFYFMLLVVLDYSLEFFFAHFSLFQSHAQILAFLKRLYFILCQLQTCSCSHWIKHVSAVDFKMQSFTSPIRYHWSCVEIGIVFSIFFSFLQLCSLHTIMCF